MSAPPPVPSRPARSTATASSEEDNTTSLPSIPPRPVRSKSPMPTNENYTAEISQSSNLPHKSPGVRFQEPTEEEEVDNLHLSDPPKLTKTVGDDVVLEQPTAVHAARTSRSRDASARNSMIIAGKEEDRLPPEIGQRVPMLAHAGDVQAPSPVPGSSKRSSSKHRSQHRKSQQYILGGHGDTPIVGDFGAYPTGLHAYKQGGTYSMSSEDLNKSVMEAVHGAGVATTPGLEGTPDEEIAYMATEEWTSRNASPMASPGVGPLRGHQVAQHIMSPLARGTLATENDEQHQLPSIDASQHEVYKGTNASTSSLHVPSGARTPEGWTGLNSVADFQDERHEGTPILASDELNKSTHFLPPAVSPRMSPTLFRRPSKQAVPTTTKPDEPAQDEDDDVSEPTTPVKELEPLFPDSPVDKSKFLQRPRMADKRASSQRFPSRDIWEDTPDSAQMTYEVKDPEPEAVEEDEEQQENEKPISQTTGLEDEVESAKKEQEEEAEAKKILSGDREERSVAIASEPPKTDAPPPLPSSRPQKKPQAPETTADASETSPISPDSAEKKAPVLPDRPKPQVPSRPARQTSQTSDKGDSTVTSPDGSKPPPPAIKPKPAVPAKVGGGIAALRANFMNDLNNKLFKGPVAPKKEEPAEEVEAKEKEPLDDVRKGRARGPARRKPQTAAESTAPTTSTEPSKSVCSIFSAVTLFHLGEDGKFSVNETHPVDNTVPIETTIAEAKDGELPTAETDTAKEVMAITPAPAPESEPSSAVEPSINSSLPSDLQVGAAIKEKGDVPLQPAEHTSEAKDDMHVDESIQTGEMVIETSHGAHQDDPGTTTHVILGGDAKTGENVVA